MRRYPTEKQALAEARAYASKFLGDSATHTKERIAELTEKTSRLELEKKALDASVARLTAELNDADVVRAAKKPGRGDMRDEERRAYELKISLLARDLTEAERARDAALARAETLHAEGVSLRRDKDASGAAAAAVTTSAAEAASTAAAVRTELERRLAAAELDVASYKAEAERVGVEWRASDAAVGRLERSLEDRAAEVAGEKAATTAARAEAERWRAEVEYYREHRSAEQVGEVKRWAEQRAAASKAAADRAAQGEAAPLTPGERDADLLARVNEAERKAAANLEYGQRMAALVGERTRQVTDAEEKIRRAAEAHASVTKWAADLEADATRQLSLMLEALKKEKAERVREQEQARRDLQGAELRAKEAEAEALKAQAEVAKFREAAV